MSSTGCVRGRSLRLPTSFVQGCGRTHNQRVLCKLAIRWAASADLSGIARLWGRGFIHPTRAMGELPDRGRATLGMTAVLIRFAVTDIVETLPQAVAGRRPFRPTRLPIAPEAHYRVQLVILPVFGVGTWLAMGGFAWALLRLTGQRSEVRRLLDALGLGMLIPMPPLWVSDILMIVCNHFRLPGLAITHTVVQLWETVLFVIGFQRQGISCKRAALASAAASLTYVFVGSRVIR